MKTKTHHPFGRSLRRLPVASACSATLLMYTAFAQAQQAPAAPAAQPESLETVVVIGIRKSLESALNMKRNASGVVDGIVAEDIGKFPDTNLAESMQRIAGVSIDRAQNGEGAKVTVRGVGPDFNMVLLNGRQMPAATIAAENGGNSGSRAFDLSYISPDAVSAVEVAKTGRAWAPTGGIGATIDVRTARPLDTREQVASLSVKLNHDQSNDRLPSQFKGSSLTPEISGIYSDVFLNGTLGIAVNGNYSKRDSGFNKGYTQNGWRTFTSSSGDWGSVPNNSDIKNRPTGIYSTSVDMRYSITAVQRERLNGQLVLEYAPSKNLRFRLDHIEARNTVHQKNAENSSWFNFSFNRPPGDTTSPYTTFTSGPVASPLIEANFFPNNDHDYALNNGLYAEKNRLSSNGFNVDWKVSKDLSVGLDAHHSTSATRPDSPYGSYAVMDMGMFAQGNAFAYYDQKLPILSLPTTKFDASKFNQSGSQFVNHLANQTIDQLQLKTSYKLSSEDKLSAGLGFTRLKDRRAEYNHQNDDWGGLSQKTGDFANVPVYTTSLGGLFTAIPGHDDPRLHPTFYVLDFEAQRAQAIQVLMATRGVSRAQAEAYFLASPDYAKGNDWRTTEKTTSAYFQWDTAFEAGVPMNLSAGVRYESTKVEGSSQIVSRTSASWISQNEFALAAGPTSFGTATGKYSYFLPSIDWDADITPDLKLRASYGHNIGRPTFDNLLGGVNVGANANAGGGNGSSGNPNLKPWLAKAFDLSAEYYYAKSSYVATSAFYKKITNFITGSSVKETIPGVTTPVGGAYYNAALAACGAGAQPLCLRNYIFTHYAGQPGVVQTGINAAGEILGHIDGLPNDPLVSFTIGRPGNGKGDNIKGLEFNFQHMFGKSGFGVKGNFTKVKTGLKYDVANTGGQAPLLGVSDSANIEGFYEDDVWSLKGAVNWRGKFLSGTTDGGGNSPFFTEPYTTVDMKASFRLGKNLSLSLDVLNATDSYQRAHARTEQAVQYVLQTGRRYILGAQYKF